MYKFLQKYGKQLMAVFSAILMIAFALPSASKYTSGNRDRVVGRFGDDSEKLRSSELYNAQQSWKMLKTIPQRNGQGSQADLLPREVGAEIEQRPMMYLLLQKEAQAMGVAVSNDMLQTELVNTPGYEVADDQRRQAMQKALSDLLLVLGGFQRGASTIKVSDPMVQRELAELGQSIQVKAVDFPAAKYKDKVAAPTADQLKAQFEKYADTIKGTTTTATDNPFGFGYKYPNRLKLQYIAMPRETVRKSVEAAKTPYEWRVDAQKYYLQNQSQFPSTQPVKDEFSLGAGGSKRTPTTRPFGEVEAQIKDQLIDAETSKRVQAILDRINTAVAGDWVAYHNTPAGTTTAPSSLKVSYDTLEYLQKLAASVQEEFKVLPTVVSLAEKWLNGDDLKNIPGLGSAMADLDVGQVPSPLYLMARTSAFAAPDHRDDSGMLHLFEPARPIRDSAQVTYLVRLSAADPSHRPATLAEVEAQVRDDLLTAEAFKLAKAEAAKLLDDAHKKGLNEAAGGKGVATVGPLSKGRDPSVPALGLPPGVGAARFISGAFDLLATPASRPSGKPVALIELPREGRAIVTELGDVEATWTARSLPFEQADVRSQLSRQFTQGFVGAWFNYSSVAARTKFVADDSFKDSEAPAAPPPPVAPVF